jgi:NAD(P)-dependent dehydrogenase (short-subunit alcohol dehydrogenase family)
VYSKSEENNVTQLANQTVLVTGANRGMGKEYVAQLLTRGVAKVYAAARDAQTIEVSDPRIVPLELDVTDPASVARAVEATPDVSVLINNAGIAIYGSVLNPDTSSLRRELETNLFGPLALTAALADRLAQRSGVVVNVASIVSWIGVGGTYGVSKAALWSATDSMRIELASRGIQVVGVYVAYVDTEMTIGVDAPKADPSDVVRAVLDGVEAGELEVLADKSTRAVRENLNQPIEAQLARITNAS